MQNESSIMYPQLIYYVEGASDNPLLTTLDDATGNPPRLDDDDKLDNS